MGAEGKYAVLLKQSKNSICCQLWDASPSLNRLYLVFLHSSDQSSFQRNFNIRLKRSSIIYILKVYIPDLSGDRRFFKSEGPVHLLFFHPRPNETFALMNSVFEISNRLIEQKSPVDFMCVLFTVMNATPLHRGSALVSKVYSMALYGYVFKKPMPVIPDGFDVLSMLEPNFETFDERYRPIFFPP